MRINSAIGVLLGAELRLHGGAVFSVDVSRYQNDTASLSGGCGYRF